MPYTYLLDTNIISDLVRKPTGKVFQRISKAAEDSICTSIIVALGLTVVTANLREFSRVPTLNVESWL
jgi:predicted nucleic acid-binding protein